MVSKEVMTKYQALHDFCNQRGWGTLLSDGVHDIFDLFHFTPNLSLERAILRELSLNRTLMKKDLDRLKETHQGNSIQVAQCILRYKLSYACLEDKGGSFLSDFTKERRRRDQ